jgi:hypothetical protein
MRVEFASQSNDIPGDTFLEEVRAELYVQLGRSFASRWSGEEYEFTTALSDPILTYYTPDSQGFKGWVIFDTDIGHLQCNSFAQAVAVLRRFTR